MKKLRGPTNPDLRKLIQNLRILSSKENVGIWKAIANELEKPTRARRSVNISKINKYARDNETIIVPGKVLGSGNVTKEVTVAAFQFSESAKNKLKNFMLINDLIKKNPKGKNVRIMG
ncbi:50S ribosomal protein L18e [Candidatus Woesearchaeota archaeon]|nr:50S ribosomal protein L18e [Candidatus Woesearchaeota archaeon]